MHTRYNITVAAANMMGEGPRIIIQQALTDTAGRKPALLLLLMQWNLLYVNNCTFYCVGETMCLYYSHFLL